MHAYSVIVCNKICVTQAVDRLQIIHSKSSLVFRAEWERRGTNPCHSQANCRNMYCIAGNFCWVQIFAIFADRPASAKIKTAKKLTKTEIDDVVMCVHRYELVPVSVCALNGRCREESACHYTNCHEPVVEAEISSAESFCSTSQFLSHGGSSDTCTLKVS